MTDTTAKALAAENAALKQQIAELEKDNAEMGEQIHELVSMIDQYDSSLKSLTDLVFERATLDAMRGRK